MASLSCMPSPCPCEVSCPSQTLEPGISAQGEVHADRFCRAAADDAGALLDHVGRTRDTGEVGPGQLNVEVGGLEWLGRADVQADRARGVCISHSSTRQASGTPAVVETVGASSPGRIARPRTRSLHLANRVNRLWSARRAAGQRGSPRSPWCLFVQSQLHIVCSEYRLALVPSSDRSLHVRSELPVNGPRLDCRGRRVAYLWVHKMTAPPLAVFPRPPKGERWSFANSRQKRPSVR